MYDGIINQILPIPIRLEDINGTGITGKTNADLTVTKADPSDTAWVTVVVGDRSLVPLGSGDYTLNIFAAIIDEPGFFRVKVTVEGAEDKQYVSNILRKTITQFIDAVICEFSSAFSGTGHPNGTHGYPVNNLGDAGDIAGNNKISKIIVHAYSADKSIAGNKISGLLVMGEDSPDKLSGRILLASQQIATRYKYLRLKSTVEEQEACYFEKCNISDRLDIEASTLFFCFIEKDAQIVPIRATAGAPALDLFELSYFDTGSYLNLSSISNEKQVNIFSCAGFLTIKNMTNINITINIHGFRGEIIRDVSCTNGTVNIVGGGGKLTDNGVGGTLNNNGFIEDAAIPGDKMDLLDTLKNKAGASGYDRTTDSLEAIGEKAQDVISKAKFKDLIFNREVTQRHPSGPGDDKPKTIIIGAAGAEGTVSTLIDGDGNLDKESIA